MDDGSVPRVVRLLTFVETKSGTIDPREISVSARHEAELDDGRRVLLLDDRGWSESGPSDVWQRTSLDDVVVTARVVVGPDEPFDRHTVEDMAAEHWEQLAGTLQQHGVAATADDLARLPHEVVLSDRLLAGLGRGPDPSADVTPRP